MCLPSLFSFLKTSLQLLPSEYLNIFPAALLDISPPLIMCVCAYELHSFIRSKTLHAVTPAVCDAFRGQCGVYVCKCVCIFLLNISEGMYMYDTAIEQSTNPL